MKSKVTTRYHLTPAGTAVSENQEVAGADEDVETRGPSARPAGLGTGAAAAGTSVEVPRKVSKRAATRSISKAFIQKRSCTPCPWRHEPPQPKPGNSPRVCTDGQTAKEDVMCVGTHTAHTQERYSAVVCERMLGLPDVME